MTNKKTFAIKAVLDDAGTIVVSVKVTEKLELLDFKELTLAIIETALEVHEAEVAKNLNNNFKK